MDVNIPPVVAILGGLGLVGLCFAFKIPIFVLGLLSLILLVYTVIVNRSIFQVDYDAMTFGKSIAAFFGKAPTNGLPSLMIIATVIILALGYIIHLFGLSSLFTNAPMFQGQSAPQSQYRNVNSTGRRNFISALNRAV
jgi:hypothetical protein